MEPGDSLGWKGNLAWPVGSLRTEGGRPEGLWWEDRADTLMMRPQDKVVAGDMAAAAALAWDNLGSLLDLAPEMR